jgi:hypothetical protein
MPGFKVSGAVGFALACGLGAWAIAATIKPHAAAPRAEAARATGGLPKFADFGQLPPPSSFTPDRVFRLSADYPAVKPPVEPEVAKILAIDYTKDWRGYMDAVLDYVLQGNIENRSVGEAFFLEDNHVRRWYHVPWQQWGDDGREGLHGLTAEGPVNPYVLSPQQSHAWQTYAVGFYNDLGGYEIGRVWADPQNPRIDVVERDGGFPVGTVVAKLLFTTTPVAEAPFLSNPIEWNAYTKLTYNAPGPTGLPITPRQLSTVRLIQVDMMVRDERANATGGWVFGTWVYNGRQTKFVNRWRNLVPVGLMWGNDPKVTSYKQGNPAPTRTLTNPDLRQTIINANDPALPPMHLGFGLRLSGPVDNTLSSCKSCHSAAEYPAISPILAFLAQKDGRPLRCTDPEWMLWFRNLGPTEPFDKQAQATDNSLQLSGSIQNFITAKSIREGGLYAVQYWHGRPVLSIYGERGIVPAGAAPCSQ